MIKRLNSFIDFGSLKYSKQKCALNLNLIITKKVLIEQ